MTTAVSVRECRARLSELLDKARSGETVIVTRRGQEVARIQPPEIKPDREGGWYKGKIWYAEDWDETPEDIIDAMEGNDSDDPL